MRYVVCLLKLPTVVAVLARRSNRPQLPRKPFVPADDPVDRKLVKRYRLQFGIGALLLASLIAPALIHSAAAIGTLRNLPALWLPEDMPIRKDFFRFIENFAITDTVMITWPDARLQDESVAAAMAWLEPLSGEIMQGVPVPEILLEDPLYARIFQLAGDHYPLLWVRSGQQLVESLTARPLNLSEAEARRRLQGSFIGPDEEQLCLVVSLDMATSPHHQELLPLIRQGIAEAASCSDTEVILVGGPVDGAAIDGAAIRSISRFSMPSSAIAAVLCFICLRSLVLSGTIVAIATITQGMVLASIYYAGYDLNAVLIILPALAFVLTISAGIHLSNYFREVLQKSSSGDRLQIVRSAMKRGYKPCTMSVLTTVVGLLSLLLVRIQPVQLFGVAASCALFFSLAMLFLMMPGAMLLARKPSPKTGQPIQENSGALMRLLDIPLRHRWVVFAAFAALTLTAASGLSRLRSSVRVPDMFAENSQLNRDYRWFEEHVGPTMTGELLITFQPDVDSDALARLATVQAMHAAVAEVDGIGGINSGVTFLPALPTGSGLANVTTRAVIRSMVENDSSLLYDYGFLRKNEQEEIWRLTFRLFQTDTVPADDRLNAISQAVASVSEQQEVETALTGHIVVVEQTQKILLEDLVRSFIAAFVVIALFMSIMVGNPVGGLLSMIPNMIPTLVLFGMMGWWHYSLDIGSVMTASVALGIAVDDTLHLLAHFRSARKQGLELQAAAREAIGYCGVAMLHTTVVCGTALAIYYASEFKPTQRFAIFMGILLAMAWLGVSVLLPAMMTSRVGRWLGSR